MTPWVKCIPGGGGTWPPRQLQPRWPPPWPKNWLSIVLPKICIELHLTIYLGM
jgi:hypothetical protein